MPSVNKWIGIGNLTKDPDVRYMQNGEAVTNITVACNESWKTKEGEKKENVEFIRVVFYRKLAEIVGQYLKKGSAVYIEGRIRTRKWQDKEGQERYTTEIEANEMQMLGGKPEAGSAPQRSEPSQPKQDSKPGSFEDMDDDIPF